MEIKEHQGLRKIVQKNEENPTEIQYTPVGLSRNREKLFKGFQSTILYYRKLTKYKYI